MAAKHCKTFPPSLAIFMHGERRDRENVVMLQIIEGLMLEILSYCLWFKHLVCQLSLTHRPEFITVFIHQINKSQAESSNSKAQKWKETTYLFWDYTHMKCEPSVSCGWVDGTGDAEDSGDGDRLCTKTHRENVTRSKSWRHLRRRKSWRCDSQHRTCVGKEFLVAFRLCFLLFWQLIIQYEMSLEDWLKILLPCTS